MSLVLDNNRMEQVSGGFLGRTKILPSILGGGDRTVVRVVVHDEMKNDHHHHHHTCSSSSSSIGMNSDDDDHGHGHDDDDKDGEEEVESKLKTTPFDSAVDALEQALPMRRGMSKFYSGKSKSFASLADASCASVKDITKPENAYSRKRKNLLAYSLLYDKGRSSLLKSPGIGGGIAKKSTSSSRSTLALAVAMNNCEGPIDENGSVGEANGRNNSRTPSISPPLSPVPPPPWRSFSLADLQHCASALNSNLPSPLMGRSKPDEYCS